ncbi:MAG: hypothetical protein H5T84_10365 [Thermoleophilia bacterium]|nr:hypothetical protein [Thermoleophilia bacterium]
MSGDELVIVFPAGHRFQADQVERGDNPRILAEILREITGRPLRVTARVLADPAAGQEQRGEDARILTSDELIEILKEEFDARLIDDGLAH